MHQDRLYILFKKCLDNSISTEEKHELHALLSDPAHEEIVKSYVGRVLDESATASIGSVSQHSIVSAIVSSQPAAHKTGRRIGFRWLQYAAAIFFLFTAIGLYYLLNHKKEEQTVSAPAAPNVQPGGNRATLTLSDGSVIALDSTTSEQVAEQAGINIVKLADGQLLYKVKANTSSATPVQIYNTVSTPKGGQYQVLLPDGTKVWLNAASSLRFPVLFAGNERRVELTGEGFFEVHTDKNAPFIVKALDAEITVLGTEFNIMAYADEEAMKTTLVKGAVKIATPAGTGALRPGEQASINGNQMNISRDANIEEALAWKNGRFYFYGADAETVMRQISRWYDVNVEFKGAIPDEKFEGEISRSATLTEVFRILELSSGHFKIEGKKVTVLP